jgi:hypothetical protein
MHEDPTFAGSPAWRTYMTSSSASCRTAALGLARSRYRISATRGAPRRRWSLAVDGKPVPVASYWATRARRRRTVSARPGYYDPRNPPDIGGRIVVFDVPALPNPAAGVPAAGAWVRCGFASRASPAQWYQSNYRPGSANSTRSDKGPCGRSPGDFRRQNAGQRALYLSIVVRRDHRCAGLYLDRESGAAAPPLWRGWRHAAPCRGQEPAAPFSQRCSGKFRHR